MKVENYELQKKKNTKTFEKYTKIEKVVKFGDIEVQKQKFHQQKFYQFQQKFQKFHKRPISIKNMDINKIRVSNKVSFGKRDLSISMAAKIIKKLDLYVCFSKDWVNIEETLMKLNTCPFWKKMISY